MQKVAGRLLLVQFLLPESELVACTVELSLAGDCAVQSLFFREEGKWRSNGANFAFCFLYICAGWDSGWRHWMLAWNREELSSPRFTANLSSQTQMVLGSYVESCIDPYSFTRHAHGSFFGNYFILNLWASQAILLGFLFSFVYFTLFYCWFWFTLFI